MMSTGSAAASSVIIMSMSLWGGGVSDHGRLGGGFLLQPTPAPEHLYDALNPTPTHLTGSMAVVCCLL